MLPLDFTWTAPETCPTRAQVVEQLSQAVDVEGKELPPLAAHAVVTQDGTTWRLELLTEMDGRRGTRQLEADSCEGLARAATLVLALTLGEGLARRQAEAEAVPPPSPSPPPPPVPHEPSVPPPLAPEPKRWLSWAAAAIGTNPLGAFGPGAALGVAYRPGSFQLGARFEATLPRSTELSAGSARVQARATGFAFGVEACLVPARRAFELQACATGGLTLLDVQGRGTEDDRHVSVPLYGLGPSLGARWLLHPQAFLSLDVVSRFFVARPDLRVEGLPEQLHVESATVSGELGGGVRW